MTAKILTDKVQEAFTDKKAQEYLDSYLQAIRVGMTVTEDKFLHSIQFMLLLVIVFELLIEAAISEVNLGPIKLSDLRLFQKILPVGIAYMYYTTNSFLAIRKFQREVHDTIMKHYYPSIYNSDLEYYLLPASTMIIEEVVAKGSSGFGSSLIYNLTIPIILIMLFTPIAFEVYALIRCFAVFGMADILLWISLIVSIVFMVQGSFIFWKMSELTG
jgi:hypothetical protein